MKTKILIYLILFSIIAFVVLTIFTSGENHVIVVSENEHLTSENKSLKKENSNLKTLNNQLLSENNQLKETNLILSKPNEIPKIIVRVEKDIHTNLGWVDATMALELVTEKLKRKPTKQEYEETLKDLHDAKLLYFPGNPDPYLKGKRYKEDDIKKALTNYK